MTGKTHREGGLFCALLGFLLLHHFELLYSDVSYILQFLVIYPFALYGCVASDFDHHWESCPDKTLPTWVINKLLHVTTPLYRSLDLSLTNKQKRESMIYKFAKLFSANHRSWQTHSDLTLFIMLFMLKCSLAGNFFGHLITKTESVILSLILTGFSLGIIAHFILDMLTPQGVWFTLGVVINKVTKSHKLPVKLRFVPKSKKFATGTAWEDYVRGVLKKLTVLLAIVFVITLLDPSLIQRVIEFIKSFSINFKIK